MKLFSSFIVTMLFFLFFLILTSFSSPSFQDEICSLNALIDKLENMKRGYHGKTLFNQMQGELDQFRQEEIHYAKRDWIFADENKAIRDKIGEILSSLKIKRNQLCTSLKNQGL